MKKLFLAASFKDVATLLPDFAGGDLSGKTVTFIPTAALHEKVNFYVKAGRKALEKIGLQVDELEISTAEQADIVSKLQNNDYIYISGGNSFFLLQELRRTGADAIIRQQIEAGKLYIGESAGSVILAPAIDYVKAMDDYTVAAGLNSFDALNVIDFYPLPHQNCFPFQKTVEKIIADYNDSLALQPISNAQVILVTGGDRRISAAK
ncbi:MAG: Type 1 glutamine amidotransferase-like domain-containing protein [Sporomusaceae bacterium]|nr:Type 1 glutamine amidotransferase-like domain-containing protein [Sporomusaceae bacterium]